MFAISVEASSSASRNVDMSMTNNKAFLSVDVATPSHPVTGLTFESDENVCTSNYHTPGRQSCHNFLSAVNGGLIGRTNNNMFSSINHTIPYTGTTPIRNQFSYEHPFNVIREGNTILFTEQNFSNMVLQVKNALLFSHFY